MSAEHRFAARTAQARWAALFAARDWTGLAALYTDQPAFYGSTPDLHGSREAVQVYFEALPAALAAARYAEPAITPLGADGFAASGDVVFVAVTEMGEVELPFRMTQVFVREGEGWRIAVHHASARPGPLLPVQGRL